jgi:hypothetical protein
MLLALFFAGMLLSACSRAQPQPVGISGKGDIAMLCPENHAVEVTTDELIKIYFKAPPVYDPDGYITIYEQDGAVLKRSPSPPLR